MSTLIKPKLPPGPTVLLPDIRIRPEREPAVVRAQASLIREWTELAPRTVPARNGDEPRTHTTRREISSFIHGQPRTRKRSQVLGVGDGFTAFHVADQTLPSPGPPGEAAAAEQTDRLAGVPPHLATIARYLQNAFVGRSVSVLTQAGRFQGILTNISRDGISLDGPDGVRRVLPFTAMLGVAPS